MLMFHKLGGLYPGRFLKPNPVEYNVCVSRMALSQVYGYHGCRLVKRQWLNSLCNYTCNQQFVQWSVITTRAHIILPQQNNLCRVITTTVFPSYSRL